MISFVFLLQHDFSLNKLINNNIHTFHDCTKNGLFLLYEECSLRFQKKKNVEQRLFALTYKNSLFFSDSWHS